MARVLHLTERCDNYQTREGLAAVTRALGGEREHSSHLLGDGAAGIVQACVRLRRDRKAGTATHDIIHAWGERALTAAAMGSRARIVYSPAAFPDRRSIGWVRAVCSYRDVNVVCPTDTMRRAFVEGGVSPARVHLIRPGVNFAKVVKRKDHELRERLGIGLDDYVLLAAGESTRAASHRDAAWASVLLHVLDRRYRLLLWGEGPLAASVNRLADRMGQPRMLIDATRTLQRPVNYEELVTAADCVVVTARGPVSTLPINVSMAVGLPHIATVTETVAELLEDRHTALFCAAPTARAICRRVMDLREDPAVQWQIQDMASTEAFEFFSMTRFVSGWRSVYEQISAGKTVDLPREAPGAGLRFHGRA